MKNDNKRIKNSQGVWDEVWPESIDPDDGPDFPDGQIPLPSADASEDA